MQDPIAAADESLYTWWFNLLPPLFGGRAPTAGADSNAPFATGLANQALKMAEQTLGPLYEGYHKLLTTNPPEQVLGALNQMVRGRIDQLVHSLGGLGEAVGSPPDAFKLLSGWATGPAAMWGEGLKPVSLNLERAYGGLADAFGLAPSRQLQDAARDMTAAGLAHKQAQAEFASVMAGAFTKGAESMMARLGEMARRGESIESMLGLVRLWAKATDDAMHEAMQSPPALAASAKLVHAAGKSRQQQQRVVAIVSQALNVPTRQEVDEAYREIQELKRELRRLRKGDAAMADPPARASRTATRTTNGAASRPAAKTRASAKRAGAGSPGRSKGATR